MPHPYASHTLVIIAGPSVGSVRDSLFPLARYVQALRSLNTQPCPGISNNKPLFRIVVDQTAKRSFPGSSLSSSQSGFYSAFPSEKCSGRRGNLKYGRRGKQKYVLAITYNKKGGPHIGTRLFCKKTLKNLLLTFSHPVNYSTKTDQDGAQQKKHTGFGN